MIYLDYAATSPTRPEVIEAIAQEMAQPGNPSSLHSAGQRARSVVDDAREIVAAAVGCRAAEVIATSGGTESDNLAIKGCYWAQHSRDSRRTKVLVPCTEHHAVLDAVQWLADEQGAELVDMPIQCDGRLDLPAIEQYISEHHDSIALVTAMWANNETGTIHPIEQLGEITKKYSVVLHSDASQAFCKVPIDFQTSNCDMLTLSGHKIGGPVGVGALVATTSTALTPVHHGGGQERKVRSGTLDAAGMAGFGVAVTSAMKERDAEARRLARLRNQMVGQICDAIPGVVLTGPALADDDLDAPLDTWSRLPHIAHITIDGCKADALLFLLDREGVCCSSGSACSAGAQRGSHVVHAMHDDDSGERGVLRLSLGYGSSEADVEHLVKVLPGIVKTAREACAT